MPEDPNPGILDKAYARVASAETASLTQATLGQLVARGTNLLGQILQSTSCDQNERDAVCGLLRHCLVMADGLEELVVAGAANAGVPVLRSLFEGWLQLRFLFSPADPASVRRKALCWQVVPEAARLERFAIYDTRTQAGQDFLRRVAEEIDNSRITPVPIEAVERASAAIREWLEAPQIAPVYAEYLKTKGNSRVPPAWHSLYGGPRSLRQLAVLVGLTETFDELYGHMSQVGHGKDSRQLYEIKEGVAIIKHLRDPSAGADLVRSGVTYLSEVIGLVAAHASKDEGVAFWRFYVDEVRPSLHELWRLCSPANLPGEDGGRPAST